MAWINDDMQNDIDSWWMTWTKDNLLNGRNWSWHMEWPWPMITCGMTLTNDKSGITFLMITNDDNWNGLD